MIKSKIDSEGSIFTFDSEIYEATELSDKIIELMKKERPNLRHSQVLELLEFTKRRVEDLPAFRV